MHNKRRMDKLLENNDGNSSIHHYFADPLFIRIKQRLIQLDWSVLSLCSESDCELDELSFCVGTKFD